MQPESSLATVLFTDIVGSTERAVELRDEGWHDLQQKHHARVRMELRRFGGHEVNTAGDSFLATFERPARQNSLPHVVEKGSWAWATSISRRAGARRD